MQAHHDGTHLLEAVLWRLDEYVSGTREAGAFTRVADRATGALPSASRHRAFSAFAPRARHRVADRFPYAMFNDPIPPRVDRRWWSQPNNTVIGSVRLNVFDREPEGRILRSRSRQAACWLASRLLDLVNLDTGEPVVERVLLTDDHYARFEGDAFGDLIVEWNRNAPIERVWSPATGVVQLPYDHWRTGDHHQRGLLLATGPGIEPGRRAERVDVVHVGPTLAASLGVELPDVDGVPVWDLVPEPMRRGEPAVTGLRTIPERLADPPTIRRWPERYEVTELARQHRTLPRAAGSTPRDAERARRGPPRAGPAHRDRDHVGVAARRGGRAVAAGLGGDSHAEPFGARGRRDRIGAGATVPALGGARGRRRLRRRHVRGDLAAGGA